MTDEDIAALEREFPRLSGQAFKEASDRALAAGELVLQTEDGVIYRYFPDGTRTVVKMIEPATRVTPGTKIQIQ